MKVSSKFQNLFRNQPEKLDQFKLAARNSGVLEPILKLIQRDIKTVEKITGQTYDQPSWAYYQAHRNGQLEELRSLEKMFLQLLGRDPNVE